MHRSSVLLYSDFEVPREWGGISAVMEHACCIPQILLWSELGSSKRHSNLPPSLAGMSCTEVHRGWSSWKNCHGAGKAGRGNRWSIRESSEWSLYWYLRVLYGSLTLLSFHYSSSIMPAARVVTKYLTHSSLTGLWSDTFTHGYLSCSKGWRK